VLRRYKTRVQDGDVVLTGEHRPSFVYLQTTDDTTEYFPYCLTKPLNGCYINPLIAQVRLFLIFTRKFVQVLNETPLMA
jgi:hypothetical protein